MNTDDIFDLQDVTFFFHCKGIEEEKSEESSWAKYGQQIIEGISETMFSLLNKSMSFQLS